MDPRFSEIFDKSLGRCLNDPLFLERFYHRFLASSQSVREKFRHTDFQRQIRMLEISLYAILSVSENNTESENVLRELAAHHRTLNISDEQYQWWLNSLLETAANTDPLYNPDIEQAWRGVLQHGIDLMLNH